MTTQNASAPTWLARIRHCLSLNERERVMARVLAPRSWLGVAFDIICCLLVIAACVATWVDAVRYDMFFRVSPLPGRWNLCAYWQDAFASPSRTSEVGVRYAESLFGVTFGVAAVVWFLLALRVWWTFVRLRNRLPDLFLSRLSAEEWTRILHVRTFPQWMLMVWPLIVAWQFALMLIVVGFIGDQAGRAEFFSGMYLEDWLLLTFKVATVVLAVVWVWPEAVRSGWLAWRSVPFVPLVETALVVAAATFVFCAFADANLFFYFIYGIYGMPVEEWCSILGCALVCWLLVWRARCGVEEVRRGLRNLPREARDGITRLWLGAEWIRLRSVVRRFSPKGMRELLKVSWSAPGIIPGALCALLVGLLAFIPGWMAGAVDSAGAAIVLFGPMGLYLFAIYRAMFAMPSMRNRAVENQRSPLPLESVESATNLSIPWITAGSLVLAWQALPTVRNDDMLILAFLVVFVVSLLVVTCLCAFAASAQLREEGSLRRSLAVHAVLLFGFNMMMGSATEFTRPRSNTSLFAGPIPWVNRYNDEMTLLLTAAFLAGVAFLLIPQCQEAFNDAVERMDAEENEAGAVAGRTDIHPRGTIGL